MSKYSRGIIYTIAGGICWGISGTCGQYLCSMKDMDTRWLTAMRLLGAGIILLCTLLLRDRHKISKLFRTPKAFLHCIIFGICGLMLTQYTYITAISKTNAGTATVLQYLSVIFVLVFVCLRTKKLPTFRENLAILSCLVGTFFVTTHGSFSSLFLSKQGLLWGMLAAVAATLYILIPQNLLKTWGSLLPIGIGMLSGGIAFFFLMQVYRVPLTFDAATAWITAMIILIGTVFAFTLFLKGTSIIGPARANMIGCIEPLTATVCSAAFLQTTFAPMDIIGFAFIIATVFILARH